MKRYLKFSALTTVMATNTLIVVFVFCCDVAYVTVGGSVYFKKHQDTYTRL